MTERSQRGLNLTQADRERGGRVSAAKQHRDARGKFAGSKNAKPARSAPPQGAHERSQELQQPAGSLR